MIWSMESKFYMWEQVRQTRRGRSFCSMSEVSRYLSTWARAWGRSDIETNFGAREGSYCGVHGAAMRTMTRRLLAVGRGQDSGPSASSLQSQSAAAVTRTTGTAKLVMRISYGLRATRGNNVDTTVFLDTRKLEKIKNRGEVTKKEMMAPKRLRHHDPRPAALVPVVDTASTSATVHGASTRPWTMTGRAPAAFRLFSIPITSRPDNKTKQQMQAFRVFLLDLLVLESARVLMIMIVLS
ncbi:hypothetical protein K438DRAFT_1941780 [Mycena galopus ATCC 62051]|nr:hypothetical protein K438DRAFT_1941780 [Mycena galopus ATCC 62051]